MKNMFRSLFCLFILIFSTDLSAQYESVVSNNTAVYYRIFGNGNPVLIIGGGPGDLSDRYLSLCELLKNDIQCILVDQRGTGKSIPESIDTSTINIALTLKDFEAIRNKMGFNAWNVLGYSYGGYLASLYAHFYPESVNSLILLNSMGLNTDVFAYFKDNIESRMCPDDIERMKYWSDSTRLSQNFQHAVTERIRAMMPGYFYDREKSLLISRSLNESDFNFTMGQFIWHDVIAKNMDLIEMGPVYVGSVLILQGRQDPVGGSMALRISQFYTNSKLVYIEKCGHYSWIEQPEIVKSEISGFIN